MPYCSLIQRRPCSSSSESSSEDDQDHQDSKDESHSWLDPYLNIAKGLSATASVSTSTSQSALFGLFGKPKQPKQTPRNSAVKKIKIKKGSIYGLSSKAAGALALELNNNLTKKQSLPDQPPSPPRAPAPPLVLRDATSADWSTLLFSAKDVPDIALVPSYPEYDTYFEDCKLAEDVSLIHVAKLHIPVLDCLRQYPINQSNITYCLKNYHKMLPSEPDQAVLLTLLLDYVTACCQVGNLLNPYEKCKVSKKIDHLSSLFSSFYYINYLKLSQYRSIEKIVLDSISRLPSYLKVRHETLTTSLKRKISALEQEEKKKSASVYAFNEELPTMPVSKKPKTSSVVSTSKNWKGEKMDSQILKGKTDPDQHHMVKKVDSDLRVFKNSHRYAADVKSSDSEEGMPFTDYSCQSDESILAVPLSPSTGPSEIDSDSDSRTPTGRFTSTPESSNSLMRFLCETSSDEECLTPRICNTKKVTKKIFADQSDHPTLSKKREWREELKSEQNSFISTPKFSLEKDENDLLDSSLPDIPLLATYRKVNTQVNTSSAQVSLESSYKKKYCHESSKMPSSTGKHHRGTILDFFVKNKEQTSSKAGVIQPGIPSSAIDSQIKSRDEHHRGNQEVLKGRSPFKYLQCGQNHTSVRDSTLTQSVKNSGKDRNLNFGKTPQNSFTQPQNTKQRIVLKKPGCYLPVTSSSDSNGSSLDLRLSNGSTTSCKRGDALSPYKSSRNSWNASKHESPSKARLSQASSGSCMLLSPSRGTSSQTKGLSRNMSKFRSPIKKM